MMSESVQEPIIVLEPIMAIAEESNTPVDCAIVETSVLSVKDECVEEEPKIHEPINIIDDSTSVVEPMVVEPVVVKPVVVEPVVVEPVLVEPLLFVQEPVVVEPLLFVQ